MSRSTSASLSRRRRAPFSRCSTCRREHRAPRALSLDAGFDVYLTNPFDASELCAAVGALIRLKRQEAARIATATLGLLLDDALDALADQFAKLPVPTYLWEARGDDFMLLISNEEAVRAAPSHGGEAIGRLLRDLFPGINIIREEMITALRENRVVRCTAQFDSGPKLGMRRVELTIGPQ